MKRVINILSILTLLVFVIACGQYFSSSGTSLVTISIGEDMSASLHAEESTLLSRIPLYLGKNLNTLAMAAIPAEVVSIRLTIDGPDMETIVVTLDVTGQTNVTILVEVPNGPGRHFLVECLDANGTVVYNGETIVDLDGSPVTIPIAMVTVIYDTSPPTVISTSPAGGATGIPISTDVIATFSEPMDDTTISSSTVLLSDADGIPVSGTVTYNPNQNSVTFMPDADLAFNMQYTATITTGATDFAGNAMTNDHAWTFTTEQQPPLPGDTTAPTFSGLQSVSVPTYTSMQLSWSPASDDVTIQSALIYNIYMTTSSGGQDYSTPSFISTPGATTYTVNYLTPGTRYYFVVRARDEAGNIDTNTAERSGVAQGLYVNAVSGADSPTCGTKAAPCQSISQALINTPGNEGIFVAAGTYEVPLEVAGPFQLKPGTALFCLGAGHSTIINTDQSSDDAFWGNTGAVINGCMILPGCDQTGIVDKIGGPTGGTPAPMTINNVIIDEASAGCGPLDGIILSADSTVTNSQIRNSTFHGISIESGNPTISGNTLVGHPEAINISGGSPVINGNTFSADQTGIVSQTASAQINGNTFDTNIGTAIDVSTGTPTIQGNTITNNTDAIGIRVTAGSPTLDGNTVENNSAGTGILIEAGGSLVQNNIIQNNTGGVGVSIGGGTPTIGTGNSIIANDTGIYISGGDPLIDGNLIKGNTGTGITISFGAGNPTINNNNLYCNSIQDMALFCSTCTIDATNNSWDHEPPTTEPFTCVTPGVDICYDLSLPTYTPYYAAPADACLP